MKNKFFMFLIIPVIILSLFSGLVIPANAQGVVTPTPQSVPVSTNPNDVTFFQIRQSEIQLNGPFDSASLVFGLPANWKVNAISQLKLNVGVSFNTIVQQTVNTPVLQGGTLTVRLNGINLGAYPLNKIGELTETIDVPLQALVSQRSDGRMELNFILDSGISCYYSQQMTVFIHTNSVLTLPHDIVTPDTNLVNFPQPIYQGSVLQESALVVIPDNPSSAELQAALTVAAGLGNLTGNALTMDVTTIGKLTEEQKAAMNLVIVGKAASLPLLSGLPLALPVTGGQFKFNSGAPDDGVVQIVDAPWSTSQVVMLVSGNTDAGVVKAAQAVSTGLLRPNASQNLAVIEQVQPNPVKVSVPVDQTLGDLNLYSAGITATAAQAIKTLRFASSVGAASYRFYIPPGQTVDPTAYFDLVFGNSALLNYARSGLVVSINGQPIGSVRLSDATAGQANNHAKINIPAPVVIPGYNRIDIKATLIPTDVCVAPQLDGLWVTIWPDSTLHMPLVPAQATPLSTVDLSAYPAPFVYQPTLGTTAFVLPHDNLDAWRSALRIAGFLGNRSNGALFTLAAFYGNELKDTDRAKYNLLVIGQPSQLPVVNDMNTSLPAPFDPSSDVAVESNMQVKFNIPATAPTGYVQLLNSPWNQNNLVVAALGNSPQGVLWAASALVDAPLRSRLAGNFAIVNGAQVVTTDTRLSPYAQVTPGAGDNTTSGVVSKLDLTPLPANHPAWILPVIYLALALILVVLVVAVVAAWLRNRRGSRL